MLLICFLKIQALCVFLHPTKNFMLKEITSINIDRTKKSRLHDVDWDNIAFGKVFSDHMLVMNYMDGDWQTPEIKPFDSISLHPATSAIHYGQSVFEGMKANKNEAGDVLLFRPEMNAKRFAESCERMCMPTIDEDVFLDLVKKIIDIDREWVPCKKGFSLYIRPFMFATDSFIGIKPSDNYTFIIFTCPVGFYYSKPLRVKIEEFYTRASKGGVGRAKTAGNYGASLYPAKKAKKEGFDQLIWTDGIEHKYIEESGTMNIMFVIDGKLITPSESSDTILRGITKRSVIDIVKKWDIAVEEREISVDELVFALEKCRVSEVFGVGTAATVASISEIGFRNQIFSLPPVTNKNISTRVSQYLSDLKLGRIEDTMNWSVIV